MTRFDIDFEAFVNGAYADLEAKYLTPKEISEETAKKYLQILRSKPACKSREIFLQGRMPFVKAGWELYLKHINELKRKLDK